MGLGQSGGFIAAVILLVLGALLIQRNEAVYTADRGRLQIIEDPARDAVNLIWSHGVDAPMHRRFEEAYTTYKDRVSVFVIALDSPGGAVAEGKRVVQLMDKIAKTHELETWVGPEADCLSMCVPIYLKGERRAAAPNARFMFHEPARYDVATGSRDHGPEFERRFVSDRFFDRYFEDSPMDAEWRKWLEAEWIGKDVWKSGEDLARESSGVVTELR